METNRDTRPAVVIVEDDPMIRWSGAQSLADAGFDVLEAANAEEALAILENRGGANVLFTDIEMPGAIDGLELAKVAARRWPFMHVIITSGRREPQPRRMPGKGRFVPKPYAPEQIARDIGAWITA